MKQQNNSLECDCGHSSAQKENKTPLQIYAPIAVSSILLAIGMFLDFKIKPDFFTGFFRLGWYLIAYLPVGLPVIKSGWEEMKKKDFFNEFTLMAVATIGALCIKEYPEAVAVMLFYSVGEMFQDRAVAKAQGSIKALVDMRPETAMVLRDGEYIQEAPQNIQIGDTVQVRVGEKLPLDGELITADSSFDTSALTGESKPATYRAGNNVLAGMINLEKVIEIKVQKLFADSSLSRILEMVQDATSRKAKTELLIRRFARIYTPIVFALAVALTFIPYFIVSEYEFSKWLYRALVFLVISCPCALVLSVPLGYFGGIGAASRYGILFKGANFLDMMTKVNTVVMDKTGTLTKGVFEVQKIVSTQGDEKELLRFAQSIESQSTHPIARAIVAYNKDISTNQLLVKEVEEIAGLGLKGEVDGKVVLAGNGKLMDKFGIAYDKQIDSLVSSIVILAIDGEYAGYITIADQIKEDAKELIDGLHQHGIRQAVMLSGDKVEIAEQTAKELGIDIAYGGLLPEDKLAHVERLKADKNNVVAFVGDGINDTPVLALSDVGIAMGAMGSDAAIEVADVIIQTDQPSKILVAIKIGKSTNAIVVQNIVLALSVKAIVLALGALGIANMWEAVFADVGVSLLAVLNSVRILKMKF